MPAKPKTIDDYLAALPAAQQRALTTLRKTIRAAAPQAEECISYGLAAFKQNGMLVGFGATKNHCAFYLMSGTILDSFQNELVDYDLSKGTIRFAADEPLPARLVKTLVQARIAENDGIRPPKPTSPKRKQASDSTSVDEVVVALRKMASKKVLAGYTRFAIPTENALGISVADLRKLAKRHFPNHQLAIELWKARIYEARMLATMVDDPAAVTPAQMDRWCRDFDNWAICDTACFGLFDRTPHAWQKVNEWAASEKEFVRRAAFATLWGLTVHDKKSTDQPFLESLQLIEQYADDGRNFVKKAVNMALRAIGKRNKKLHAAAVEVAQRLAHSQHPAARWNGKDALRELTSASVQRRLGKKEKVSSVKKQEPECRVWRSAVNCE
jgi:3-methyladenine DNA glycosylase AlkD/uncharacterized protein YdhG (YjbR/CyaY superfamily)